MRITAGLVVIYRESILLVRQYYDTKNNHLSSPKGSIILGQLCQNRKEKSNVEKKPSWTFSKGISNCVC